MINRIGGAPLTPSGLHHENLNLLRPLPHFLSRNYRASAEMQLLRVYLYLVLFTPAISFSEKRSEIHAAIRPSRRQHERRSEVDDQQPLQVQLALVLDPDSVAAAVNKLYMVSDPESATFGQHLSPQGVAEMLKVPCARTREVSNWVDEVGGVGRSTMHLSLDGSQLRFDTTVEKARVLFRTQFYRVWSTHSRSSHITADKYTAPSNLGMVPFTIQIHVVHVESF